MLTNAGAMRDVVRIEERSSAQDALGEPVTTWTLVCERYAEKLPVPGREIWSANQRVAKLPTVFKMRWPKEVEIKPQMRLICKGKLYDILSAVDFEGRETDLILSCEELVGEPT